MKRFILLASVIEKDSINLRTDGNSQDEFSKDGVCRLFAPLSATGLPPATHYWASGVIDDSDVATMKTMIQLFPTATVTDWDDDKDPTGQEKFLEEKGLSRVYTPIL